MSNQAVITRQGEGDALRILGTQTRFLCTAAQTGNQWSLMEVTLPKGSGAPPHAHPWGEAYYVVSGEVGFLVGGERHLMRAGDFLYAPADTEHAFEGQSDTPARVIIFDAPAHAETFFREVDAHVRNMPADLDKMLAIGERHQVRFSPPG
ncbi:cupin domain-containing protein [Massilia sp. IC2-476]|uniref:cupin domain-containing protein n=1 Tax=Massilia sp. IC2-476 TaxID=2887199 RepID=UPI001D112866|nr:cupin domain-containing protein [Massilia sp. IC2-476]MCC2970711.1 cupin domain-containing protein [Massilia sp. IC2-476]